MSDSLTVSEERFERLERRVRLLLDVGKAFALITGAILMFIWVQHPESNLNQAVSKDAIARERAKLILHWLKEEDIQKRAEAFVVIQATYGDDGWVNDVVKALADRVRLEAQKYYTDSLSRLLKEQSRLRNLLEEETSGVISEGRTGQPESGPSYRAIKSMLRSTETKIQAISSFLKILELSGADNDKFLQDGTPK